MSDASRGSTQSPSQSEGSGGVQEATREAAGQAAQRARETAGQARDRVRAELDRRSTQGGERMGQLGGDLRSVGDELHKQGKDTPARLADQVADRTERLGGYLQEADSDRLLSDLEDFGRRQPWAVALGGVALGFVAARLLKTSSGDRYRARTASSEDWTPRGSNGARDVTPAGAPAVPPGGYEGTR
jgi:hypothetical protein